MERVEAPRVGLEERFGRREEVGGLAVTAMVGLRRLFRVRRRNEEFDRAFVYFRVHQFTRFAPVQRSYYLTVIADDWSRR